MFVDHENAFGAEEDRPAYLKEVELVIGDQWRAALLKLDYEALHAELGDLPGEDRLTALGKRRDALVGTEESMGETQ